MDQEVTEKIKTSRPGMHQAMGVDPKDIEVVPAGEEPIVDVAAGLKPGDEGYVAPVVNSQPNPNGANATEAKDDTVNPAAKESKELSDEELDEIIKKRTGKTLKELTPTVAKTKEELEAEKEQLRNEALAWAFENKKITKDKYDKSAVDTAKTNREIALRLFTENLQADDKDLSPEECEEIFRDTYHESEDASGRLQKIGQAAIDKLADAYRKENQLPDYVGEYESTLQTQSQFKAYKTQVKEVAGTLPKELSFETTIKIDGKEEKLTYNFPVEDKVMNKIIADYSAGEEFSIRNIRSDGKIDAKGIASDMNNALKARLFDAVIPEILKQNAEEVKKLTLAIKKNIPDQRQLNNGLQNTGTTTVSTQDRPGLRKALANQN